MSTLPHSAARHALLACSMAALALASTAALAAADGPAIVWSEQTLVAGAAFAGGTLTLTPEATDWGATTAVARDAVAFWTPAGTHVRLHIEPEVRTQGSNLDGIITVALVTTPVLQRIQAADDIIGVTIAYKKAQNQAYLGLVRKEKSGPEAMHGTQYGDPQGFAGDQKLTAGTGPIDMTVSIDESRISVSVPGVGDISAPHGLTKATWAKAYPAVQALNFGPGRFSAGITKASVGK